MRQARYPLHRAMILFCHCSEVFLGSKPALSGSATQILLAYFSDHFNLSGSARFGMTSGFTKSLLATEIVNFAMHVFVA